MSNKCNLLKEYKKNSRSHGTSKLKIIPHYYVKTLLQYININENNNICYYDNFITNYNYDIKIIYEYKNYKINIVEYLNFTENLDKVKNCMIKNENTIVILPIHILYKKTETETNKEKRYQSHYTTILIKDKKIYFFDPLTGREDYSIFFDFQQDVCEKVKSYLKLTDHKIYIHNTCPKSIQQTAREKRNVNLAETEGLCVGWCLLIIHLTILNKDFTVYEIVECLLKKKNLDIYIRTYIAFLEYEHIKQQQNKPYTQIIQPKKNLSVSDLLDLTF